MSAIGANPAAYEPPNVYYAGVYEQSEDTAVQNQATVEANAEQQQKEQNNQDDQYIWDV